MTTTVKLGLPSEYIITHYYHYYLTASGKGTSCSKSTCLYPWLETIHLSMHLNLCMSWLYWYMHKTAANEAKDRIDHTQKSNEVVDKIGHWKRVVVLLVKVSMRLFIPTSSFLNQLSWCVRVDYTAMCT